MALLQSGVDIAVIALWLGHESIETTNLYLHANLAMKEKALAKVLPVGTPFRRFQANDTLLTFLESLRQRCCGAHLGCSPYFDYLPILCPQTWSPLLTSPRIFCSISASAMYARDQHSFRLADHPGDK